MSIEILYDRWKRLIEQEQTRIPPHARLDKGLTPTPSVLLDTIRHIKTEQPKHVWWYRWFQFIQGCKWCIHQIHETIRWTWELIRQYRLTSIFISFVLIYFYPIDRALHKKLIKDSVILSKNYLLSKIINSWLKIIK